LGNFDTHGAPRKQTSQAKTKNHHLSLRYLRQRAFPALGIEGQRRLNEARVAVVGAGALGTHALDLLSRAGVGFLRVIDGDIVEEHNLPRQTLFDLEDARTMKPKAEAVRAHLARIDPEIQVEAHIAELFPENAEAFLEDVDLVIDGTDRPEVRYLLDLVSQKFRIPWVHGAIRGASGTVVALDPAAGICYRRLFPDPPEELENCSCAGIIGSAPAIVGALQAALAIRILIGQREEAVGHFFHIDTWTLTATSFDIPVSRSSTANPKSSCEESIPPALKIPTPDVIVRPCPGRGDPVIIVHPLGGKPIDLEKAAERLAQYGKIIRTPFVLRAEIVRSPYEKENFPPPRFKRTLLLFPDSRCVVTETEDTKEALSIARLALGE